MAKSKKTLQKEYALSHADTWAAIKNATLIVSVLINIVVLIIWLVMKLTTSYDAELSSILLGR